MHDVCDGFFFSDDVVFISFYMFREFVLAFRVMAPGASHGAAFKKHGGADTRAVVDGKAFDIKYYSTRSAHCSFCFLNNRLISDISDIEKKVKRKIINSAIIILAAKAFTMR
jgi:hypothetical protein